MKYIYIPESFNNKRINEKFNSEKEFIDCQIRYREFFEKKLCTYIDFSKLDEYIKSQDIEIPVVCDKGYNFYHKYSNIGSDYIFIRNNYHVENLTKEEIQKVLISEDLDNAFLDKTIQKVLYEEGDTTFYGTPMDETLAPSDSIVFEFAYDQKKCKSIEQLKKINEIIGGCFKLIETSMKKITNSDTSYITYTAIPDLFYQETNERKLK